MWGALNIFGKKKLANKIVDTLTLARDKFPGCLLYTSDAADE